jgi:beta-ribofuranosylaminobenzene 5'-phosphate synthase
VAERVERVRVRAPARLHFGFLDLSGELGRRFGSLGLAIEEIATELEIARGHGGVEGAEAVRATVHLEKLRAAWTVEEPISIRVREAIPAHAGLAGFSSTAVAPPRIAYRHP